MTQTTTDNQSDKEGDNLMHRLEAMFYMAVGVIAGLLLNKFL